MARAAKKNEEPESVALARRVVREEPAEIGPIIARLAAADTAHTLERTETVLQRAIDEGRMAAKLLAKEGKTKP